MVFIICLAAVNGIFIFKEIKFLQNDANIINHAGIIRGSIQRISKLELNHIHADSLIDEIDTKLEQFISMKADFRMKGYDEHFSSYFNKLNFQWKNFKKSMTAYRKNPEETNRQYLIQQSEICWDTSNDIVFSAQSASETKVHRFKKVFVISLTNISLLLLVLWLIKSYIRDKLEDMAHFDPLTGAFNRGVFNELMEKEISRTERYDRPLSLILLDIDFFKTINDKYGHHIGDKVLLQLADLIRLNIRKNDFFCRIGGDEFAIIATETNLKSALTLAGKIREMTEESEFDGAGKITVTMGVTEYVKGDKAESFIIRADNNLYKAKEAGRNRTESCLQI